MTDLNLERPGGVTPDDTKNKESSASTSQDQADVSAGVTEPNLSSEDRAKLRLSLDQPELSGDTDEFAPQNIEYWKCASREECKTYYLQIELFYKIIIDEFFQQADTSAAQYLKFSKSHVTTRRRMILLGGLLALLNVLIAFSASGETLADSVNWTKWLSLIAALYASALAIYSSIENLHGFAGRAQGFREVRELFLNAARKYEMLWLVNVRPFGFTPPACVNASIAYKRIVNMDIEVRSQAKELIERVSEKEQAGGAKPNG